MVDLLVPEVVAFHGFVPGARKDRGQLFLERMNENGSGGAKSFTHETGHAVVGIRNERLSLFVESNGVQRALLHAYAAADALGIVDMLYHLPSSSPDVRPPAKRLDKFTVKKRTSENSVIFRMKNLSPCISGFFRPHGKGGPPAPEIQNTHHVDRKITF